MKNPNPDCERNDCQFIHGDMRTTCAAYIPIYDKNGVNINPDANTTSFKVNCLSCGKIWRGQTSMDVTTYEEIEK